MKQRTRRRLLEDFIIPALNANEFPGKLFWLNKDKGIFRLYWSHKNAAKWQSEDTIVFQKWDSLKGHYKPDGKNYFMSAKQRFRAALYKLSNHVTALKSTEKLFRDYQLHLDGESKRESENLPRPKAKVCKKADQSAIRSTVICVNRSYIEKSEVPNQESISPTCHYDTEQMMKQYMSSMEKNKQLKISRQYENMLPEISQKYNKEVPESLVLRENSSTPRISHIASQPPPVYCSFKYVNTVQRNPTYHESPEVFVSRICSPIKAPQTKDDTQNSISAADEDSSGILNLSLRSHGSYTLSS